VIGDCRANTDDDRRRTVPARAASTGHGCRRSRQLAWNVHNRDGLRVRAGPLFFQLHSHHFFAAMVVVSNRYIGSQFGFVVTSPAGAVAKYCDENACLSVCPRGYLQNHTRDLCHIFVHVACVRGSILLRHVYDRLHRLWPGKGFLPH